jgi:hypothetical protein
MKMQQSSETSAQKIHMSANHSPPQKNKKNTINTFLYSFFLGDFRYNTYEDGTECSETSAYKI